MRNFKGVLWLSLVVTLGLVAPTAQAQTSDANAGIGNALPVQSRMQIYNNTTWDLKRSANAAAGTSGTGLEGAGLLFYNATNWLAWPDVITATSASRSVVPAVGMMIYNSGGNNMSSLQSAGTTTANINTSGCLALLNYTADPPSNQAVPTRTISKFFTVQATASGDTALWTPTSGKKFRVMRYQIEVTDNATQTTGGVITIVLRDGTTALAFAHDVYVPSTALDTNGQLYTSGWQDLGNGYLSTAANNVLNVNLSAAFLTGNVRVRVCGTEENMLSDWVLLSILCGLWCICNPKARRRTFKTLR